MAEIQAQSQVMVHSTTQQEFQDVSRSEKALYHVYKLRGKLF
jgi:hypothetical protein